jgi:two-component system cell cycle sensor histidine kinase/response regulator CckA
MHSGTALDTAPVTAPSGEPPLEALLGPWTASTTPVYCRDLHGRLVVANPAFLRKFGRTAAEIPGLPITELINADDMAVFRSAAAELSRPPHQAARVHRWLTPQGWRWLAWEEATIPGPGGIPVAVRAVGHDITRQRLAEELYLKLSRAVEQSPVGMVITDADGRVQYVNPKFTQVSGHTLEEIVEDKLPVLREGHASDESYQEMLTEVRSGREWRGELSRKRPDGVLIWEAAHVSSLRNPSGEITNLVCLAEDITERKRLEEQLRQAQKMESLGTLAGGVAHDFNNLLAVISGYADLSQFHAGDNLSLQNNLREIKRATQRATGLVRQILTFSRKAEADFVPLDLSQLAKELTSLLSETFPRSVVFQLELPEALPSLLGDQNQLQQVVLNLCVNARDAMPTGGTITVSTSVVSGQQLANLGAGEDKSYVCLQVNDTGTGMTPEVRARIFEPFFTTKPALQGTGLGLAVVYGIVASHHGLIDVDSTLGAGSTFKVYLPLSGLAAVAPVVPQAGHFPGGTESLLVVDDEGPLRNLLKIAFVRKGYRVASASDGLEAIDLIRDAACSIDAVLLDFNMPRATGLEVVRTLASCRPNLKVLVMSGHLTPETKAAFELLGHKDFVNKPYTLDELARRLRQLLDAK